MSIVSIKKNKNVITGIFVLIIETYLILIILVLKNPVRIKKYDFNNRILRKLRQNRHISLKPPVQ
jgi:hypothetical protein